MVHAVPRELVRLDLVWSPLILRQGGHCTAYTARSADGCLARWLLLTEALFIASVIVWLVRTWLRLWPEGFAPRNTTARRRAAARCATS